MSSSILQFSGTRAVKVPSNCIVVKRNQLRHLNRRRLVYRGWPDGNMVVIGPFPLHWVSQYIAELALVRSLPAMGGSDNTELHERVKDAPRR